MRDVECLGGVRIDKFGSESQCSPEGQRVRIRDYLLLQGRSMIEFASSAGGEEVVVLSGPTIHLCYGYGLFMYHISISIALVAYSTYQWWAGVALVDLQHVPWCTGIRVEPEILPSVR